MNGPLIHAIVALLGLLAWFSLASFMFPNCLDPSANPRLMRGLELFFPRDISKPSSLEEGEPCRSHNAHEAELLRLSDVVRQVIGILWEPRRSAARHDATLPVTYRFARASIWTCLRLVFSKRASSAGADDLGWAAPSYSGFSYWPPAC